MSAGNKHVLLVSVDIIKYSHRRRNPRTTSAIGAEPIFASCGACALLLSSSKKEGRKEGPKHHGPHRRLETFGPCAQASSRKLSRPEAGEVPL